VSTLNVFFAIHSKVIALREITVHWLNHTIHNRVYVALLFTLGVVNIAYWKKMNVSNPMSENFFVVTLLPSVLILPSRIYKTYQDLGF